MARPRNFDPETVLDLAMDTFWTYGYANTSPAQLAECTGIGKGSLYNTFGSKRELFDRVLERYDRIGAEVAGEYMSRPGTTREALRAFLRSLVDTDAAQPVRRGCLAVNTATEFADRDPEITRAIRSAQDHTVAAMAARIDQGRRDGDVDRATDPQQAAEFLMNTIAGLRVMAKTNDAPALYRIIDTALTTL
ncbi:TetR/AcrR family transcriptional repressor of nem operon [Nocardia transvalensis]|uniref:TetR/AcrR family transcriptional repressor of nem operon n=1 Tax=Nocardia transvalensis TaxID=37333 RepID=A0A7W9PFX6_9NOCA|nr:TetR/AcrR family transcriptional regulator [Nocardia transvalensis]MBB5914864.1 TetR/AcrR family transcriptional repressor of nem operon [Nocardia transvalensis]